MESNREVVQRGDATLKSRPLESDTRPAMQRRHIVTGLKTVGAGICGVVANAVLHPGDFERRSDPWIFFFIVCGAYLLVTTVWKKVSAS